MGERDGPRGPSIYAPADLADAMRACIAVLSLATAPAAASCAAERAAAARTAADGLLASSGPSTNFIEDANGLWVGCGGERTATRLAGVAGSLVALPAR